MPHPENEERRPGQVTASSTISLAGDTPMVAADDAVRCLRCGAVLTAARSVERECGPVCARLLAGEVAA